MNEKFKPSVAEIERCKEKWSNDPDYKRYVVAEKALNKVFQHRDADYLSDVDLMTKVSLLNDLYSTQIWSTYKVVEHYQTVNGLSERMAEGDLSLIKDLRKVEMGKKDLSEVEMGKKNTTRNCYSFATKFCSHHFPDLFPIYDSVVDEMLWQLKQRDNFANFHRKDLKVYEKFVGVINQLQDYYNLTDYSYKDIDVMLWVTGRNDKTDNFNNAESR